MSTQLQRLYPGLDHIANFLNALDSSDMTAKQIRTAIYAECLNPTLLELKEPTEEDL